MERSGGLRLASRTGMPACSPSLIHSCRCQSRSRTQQPGSGLQGSVGSMGTMPPFTRWPLAAAHRQPHIAQRHRPPTPGCTNPSRAARSARSAAPPRRCGALRGPRKAALQAEARALADRPLSGSWRALCEDDWGCMPAIQRDLQPRAPRTRGHADEKPAGSEAAAVAGLTCRLWLE